MRKQMEIAGLAVDSATNSPIVILREASGERVLPIWIGVVEASAIAFELEEVKVARPMTHDLFIHTLAALAAKVTEVAITDLKESTYIAEIKVISEGRTLSLDARPSDAIALALRAQAPIFCANAVLDRVQQTQITEVASEGESAEEGPRVIVHDDEHQNLQGVLENLAERDFGKYKM
jgi:bifunctional DNase/RNase